MRHDAEVALREGRWTELIRRHWSSLVSKL